MVQTQKHDSDNDDGRCHAEALGVESYCIQRQFGRLLMRTISLSAAQNTPPGRTPEFHKNCPQKVDVLEHAFVAALVSKQVSFALEYCLIEYNANLLDDPFS